MENNRKHSSPYVSGEGYSNTHGIVAHVVEYRSKGSKDNSEWLPVASAGYSGGYDLVGYEVMWDAPGSINHGDVYGSHDPKSAAKKMAEYRVRYSDLTFRIVRYPLSQNDADSLIASRTWKEREAKRLKDGTYTLVPWASEPWWQEAQEKLQHYAHVSEKKPGLIAFTKSEDQGVADRHEVMLPGRYLQDYLMATNPGYDALNLMVPNGTNVRGETVHISRLDLLVQEFNSKHGANGVLKFASTADEIEYVYTHGPDSCMSYLAGQYHGSCHPVRVYAAGDLQLAYLESMAGEEGDGETRITARCLVWPERKTIGRVYGDSYALKSMLNRLGYDVEQSYTHSLDGAKLLKIPYGQGYIMPYIDGTQSYSHHEDGEHLAYGGGDAPAGFTCGVDYDPDEEEEDDRPTCESCDDRYDDGDGAEVVTQILRGRPYRSEYWCQHCVENHAFHCIESDSYYSDSRVDYITLETGEHVATHKAEDYREDHLTGEWFHIDYIAGTYGGDEEKVVSERTVRAMGLVWHEATSSYYKADDVPEDEEDEETQEPSASIISGEAA